MWFERETKAVQHIIESRIRNLVGARTVAVISAVGVLAATLMAVLPAIDKGIAWGTKTLNSAVLEAASYVEKVGTDHFFETGRGGPVPATITIDQKVKFEQPDCLLKIEQVVQVKLRDARDPFRHTTTESWIRLGSLETLTTTDTVRGGVLSDFTKSGSTPDAYHIYVRNREQGSVRTRYKVHAGDTPYEDKTGWYADFHIFSPKPIAEFSTALLELDRWCGNKQSVEINHKKAE